MAQAPPPTGSHRGLCADLCGHDPSSLVEKESPGRLPFPCHFLPGLQQPYWLSLSLSSGLLFAYSKNYVSGPGLTPAGPQRHSSGAYKAGAATVTLVQPSLCWYLFNGEARLPNNFLLLQKKPQTPEQQKEKGEVMSQNWHLVLPGQAGLPFGPDPGTLP